MGGVRRVVIALVLVAAGCAAVRGPELDPKEHVRGERHRLLGEPMDRLWPALLDALPAEGLRVADADRGRGTIETATARYDPGTRARLAEIGDLSAARRAGLTHVDELRVTYYLLLAPAGDGGTSVRVRSRIDAVAREPAILGPGLFQILPHHVDVPSRGVVERELLERLGGDLFTAEETLLLFGELGFD